MTRVRKKSNSKRLKEARARHETWLLSQGIGKKKNRESVNEIPDYSTNNSVRLSDSIPGNGSSKKTNKYTGDYVKGIAVSHKSNLMPITSKEQAVDVSAMRRN